MQQIDRTIGEIKEIDYGCMKKTQSRLNNLTKPQGSLGRLEEVAKQICAITGKDDPCLQKKVIFTLAADHGVVKEGISSFPQEVTAQMVHNFLSGGAGINVLAKHVGAKVVVADVGIASDIIDSRLIIKKINYGTKNMAHGPAMTRKEAIRSISAGIGIFENEFAGGIDIVGTGEMGIGNTTASSAITAVFTKKPVEEITGKGTGLNDTGLAHKIKIIKNSISLNHPDPADAIDVLSKVGGFEIGGLSGIILAAASKRIPVVIDGFISGAAALIAFALAPKTQGYMLASHNSVERGHRIILKHIGLRPLFDLGMRLGEGTGAALGMGLADAAIKILTEMATFKSAGVCEKKK